MADELEAQPDGELWNKLRSLTGARIGLGRAGISMPTAPQLAFQAAHARARDAVHLPFERDALAAELRERGWGSIMLASRAESREQYLQRPDLGRRLDDASVAALRACANSKPDFVIVVADGLSALAVQRQTMPLLAHLQPQVAQTGWSLAPICLLQQGRVAAGDEIAELLGARMIAMLIGERPGLSSPDSLGIYFTYAPRIGLSDAARNCISNVRSEGLDHATAAHRLMYLMSEARRRGVSGVALKDESASVATSDRQVERKA
ncbi:MAG TPA: ethanolamine ammonia-lyase subunit EutC [Burkholderiaceae bacterium]